MEKLRALLISFIVLTTELGNLKVGRELVTEFRRVPLFEDVLVRGDSEHSRLGDSVFQVLEIINRKIQWRGRLMRNETERAPLPTRHSNR